MVNRFKIHQLTAGSDKLFTKSVLKKTVILSNINQYLT